MRRLALALEQRDSVEEKLGGCHRERERKKKRRRGALKRRREASRRMDVFIAD